MQLRPPPSPVILVVVCSNLLVLLLLVHCLLMGSLSMGVLQLALAFHTKNSINSRFEIISLQEESIIYFTLIVLLLSCGC